MARILSTSAAIAAMSRAAGPVLSMRLGVPPCRFAGVFARILDHGKTAKRPFACGKPRDRALGIGIEDCRPAPTKVPMDRKAACKRTFAAAALHGGDCDDRAHPSSVPGRKSDESSESMLSFSCLTAYCWQGTRI